MTAEQQAPRTEAGRALLHDAYEVLAERGDVEAYRIIGFETFVRLIEQEAARPLPEAEPCDHPTSMLTISTYNGPDGRMAGVEQRCECGASWRKVKGAARPLPEPPLNSPDDTAINILEPYMGRISNEVYEDLQADLAQYISDSREDVGALPDRPEPALNVDLIERTLQELWRSREADGSLTYTIPVPPNNETARAFLAVYDRLSQPPVPATAHEETDEPR